VIELPVDDAPLGLEFSPSGELIVSTNTGLVRIFGTDQNFGLKRETQLPGRPRLKEPRVSPDGRLLLIGSELEARAYVLELATLSLHATATAPSTVRGLYAVEWHSDGRRFIAGGEESLGGAGVLFEFDLGVPDRARAILRSDRLMRDLRRLPDGTIAFVTGAPEIGILESSGRVRWRRPTNTVSGARREDGLRASPDGRVIEVAVATASGTHLRFSVGADASSAVSIRPSADSALLPSKRRGRALSLTVGENSESAFLNDVPISLDPLERYRAHAVDTDESSVVIGTSWALLRVSATRDVVWRRPLSVEVDQVLVTRDARWAIAALSDGTIRWFAMSDGRESLAFLGLRNGLDWIAWAQRDTTGRPVGEIACSAGT
jgi:WD40 repeat protein